MDGGSLCPQSSFGLGKLAISGIWRAISRTLRVLFSPFYLTVEKILLPRSKIASLRLCDADAYNNYVTCHTFRVILSISYSFVIAVFWRGVNLYPQGIRRHYSKTENVYFLRSPKFLIRMKVDARHLQRKGDKITKNVNKRSISSSRRV